MVNFGVAPITPLFGGQPVRIWTPGLLPPSPRRENGDGQEPYLPPPPINCIDIEAERMCSVDAATSGLHSPAARNVNSIMAAITGTKNKRRVTFLNDAVTPRRSLKTAGPLDQKKTQDRKITKRPLRNPYRKMPSTIDVGPPKRTWKFPTKLDEFNPHPENTIEDIFSDFWKSVDEDQMENYFTDFWKIVDDGEELDLAAFWRQVENKNRKSVPKENLAAEFWKMAENNQHARQYDVALFAGHFFRMSLQETPMERMPWETPSRDLWKLMNLQEKRLEKEKIYPESFAGEFFNFVEKKQQRPATDRECMAGQFWKMIERKHKIDEIKFVADSTGQIFRIIDGYKMMKPVKTNSAEATMINEFFNMVYQQQRKDDARVESHAGNFWRMINNSKVEAEGRKTKETMAGDFWKMVDLTENLRKKRETMRRLSASAREEQSSSSSSTSSSSSSTPPSTLRNVDVREASRRSALMSASSSLEQRAFFLLTKDEVNEKPVSPPTTTTTTAKERRRTTSSSSLYSVKEEDEMMMTSTTTSDGSTGSSSKEGSPRFKVAPHYATLQQLGAKNSFASFMSSSSSSAAAAAAAAAKGGSIAMTQRKRRNSGDNKAQQCHRQNMVALEMNKGRGSLTRSKRILCVSTGANNDRKCGKRTW